MNQNSFSDNTAKLTDNVNKAINILSAVTESIIGDDAIVDVELPGNNNVQILSNNNILNRLSNVENTVKSFTSGQGQVKLVDGTNREIKVTTMPITPKKIENIENTTTFSINNNWFFEDLMFPRLVTKFDLKNNVDDDSDRVKINRVIIDISGNNRDNILNFYNENIKDKNLTYATLIQLLSSVNDLRYYEDEEILNFPLYEDDFVGKFTISDSEIIDGNLYYYVDSLYYGFNNLYDQNITSNIKLKVGDKLRYSQSIYVISNIDEKYNRIDLKREIGFDTLGVGDILEYYNEPFKNKVIEIPIGINEINCIFFKGINENYNILGNEWSNSISFVSDDLLLDGSDISLRQYYMQYVSDFGSEWMAEAKERKISAYNGIIPNTVNLVANDFKVVQINTQINSTLDINEIKNTHAQIITLKSNIKTLRETIVKQKYELSLINDNNAQRDNIQYLIDENINKLNNTITEYNTTVEYLNAYLTENKAVLNSPKYRIRGFFAIPESQYLDKEKQLGKQEIIGFDIRYRYLKLDETGVPLTTFEYNDKNNNKITGTFSDWNLVKGIYKEKKYNNESGVYEWVVENSADGSQININQIDIPISDGEKVEFMVRSVSEAGYPSNPLKSDWSNSVIIEFPKNLSTTDQLTNILNDAKSELTSIKLDQMLHTSGYYTHIGDEIVDSSDNMIYHHDSKNILFRSLNSDDKSSKMSLYDYIISLEKRIKELESINLKEVDSSGNVITYKLPESIVLFENRLKKLELQSTNINEN